jgi:hypothetical protein
MPQQELWLALLRPVLGILPAYGLAYDYMIWYAVARLMATAGIMKGGEK